MKQKVEISDRQTALVAKITELMRKKNLKSSEIARITGRSEGTISDLLNGKKSYTDKLLTVIHEALKDYLGEDTLVETRQYTKMWNIAKAGKKASDMRLIVGNSGIGKSVVFKKFAEEHESCWYIKIDRKELTWNRFLHEAAREMGIRLDRGKKKYRTSYLMDRIIEFVEEKAGSNPMLIVDESEVARPSFFREMKNLRTATEGLLCITIVGITEVMQRIGRLAGLECRSYGYPNVSYRWYPVKENSNTYTTFARRISVYRIDNISTDDIAAFCAVKGITNRKVIEMAAARWWNYEEADRAVKRAARMNIELKTIVPEEFEIL